MVVVIHIYPSVRQNPPLPNTDSTKKKIMNRDNDGIEYCVPVWIQFPKSETSKIFVKLGGPKFIE